VRKEFTMLLDTKKFTALGATQRREL
jgi:hypothetical protein